MKRIISLSTLAAAIAAAVLLPSPISRSDANAGPRFRGSYGGYYYGGSYAPGYSGYSGYGYNPYGHGAYTYVAPRAYVYPTYRQYEYSPGIGTPGASSGTIYQGYGRSRFYTQPYRQPYNPYGYGGYGQYGY